MIQTENLSRRDNESFDEFAVRLYSHKADYGLNCNQIADILNSVKHTNYDESAFRKRYTERIRGIEFQKQKSNISCKKILAISDLHFPFQLPIDTFKEYVGCNVLVLNGDLLDCSALSKFPKIFRSNPIEEMILGRDYMISLIQYIGAKEVYVTTGNHDQRISVATAKAFDCQLNELMPSSILDYLFVDGFNHYDKKNGIKTWYEPISRVLTDYNIHYDGKWWCRIGDTIFAHPFTFSSSILKTTEKAMTYFQKTEKDSFKALVVAHTHHVGKTQKGDVTLIEQGAACQVDKMLYADGRLTDPQIAGFALICQNDNDVFIEDKSNYVLL